MAKAGRCEVKTCVAHMKIRSFPAVFVGYGAVLQQATLIARRDRFIADVALACGTTALAHCVNPGRMEAFVEDGARIWLEPAPEGSKRRCPYTWELIETPGIDVTPVLASTNTVRPNKLVQALLEARVLEGLDRWNTLKPEHSFRIDEHSGRIDFLLHEAAAEGEQELLHYVEVKNCHLVYDDGWGYVRALKQYSALCD